MGELANQFAVSIATTAFALAFYWGVTQTTIQNLKEDNKYLKTKLEQLPSHYVTLMLFDQAIHGVNQNQAKIEKTLDVIQTDIKGIFQVLVHREAEDN